MITKKNSRLHHMGPVMQKTLLILTTGIALGLSGNPNTYFKIIDEVSYEWKRINKRSLHIAIRKFNKYGYIKFKKTSKNTCLVLPSKKGCVLANICGLNQQKIHRPKVWDKKWRVVVFDIPTYISKRRYQIVFFMRKLGLYRIQKSVFIYPFDCKKEIFFLTEALGIKKFVRFIVAESINEENGLKKYFHL